MKEYKGCCSKRSILEKILIAVSVLLLCLLIALFIIFIHHVQKENKDSAQLKKLINKEMSKQSFFATARNKTLNVCLTQNCVQASSQILNFIDPSVNPCDDFYNFVCGNFLKKPSGITPLSEIESDTINQLDALITEPTESVLPKSWELQKKYYNACMNTEAIESDNGYTFNNLIYKIGDWPVLQGRFWNERKFDWIQSITECRNIGFSFEHFMSITASDPTSNQDTFLLMIGPPILIDLPYQHREKYIEVMANISIELGAPTFLAKDEFTRVYKFEENIKALVQDEIRNGHEEILTVENLQQMYSAIPWIDFLNKITRTADKFTANTAIRFRATRYLYNLLNLLQKTPKSTQANYVIWKLVENFRGYLKESVRNLYGHFIAALNSFNPEIPFEPDRSAYCLTKAKFYFPSVAELAYVKTYLQPQIRQDIKEVTDEIKSELLERVKNSDWMDNNSKQISINKLKELEEHIGLSDKACNEDFDKVVRMEDFNLHTDNVIEMATQLFSRRVDNYFAMINRKAKNVAKDALDNSPVLSVNAFYHKIFNTLIIPTSFLQGVIYNFHRPQYMNYGALGSVIGHEMTHGFIPYRNKSINGDHQWTEVTTKSYESRTRCALEEYRKYNGHLREFTKDAEAALEENIADLVGVDIAYRAYQKKIKAHGSEMSLPSLSYTPNQIFWIMSNIFRCYQPKLQRNIRFDQEHAVPSFAVTFSVRNSPYFAKDFNCRTDSNMNPTEKCRIL